MDIYQKNAFEKYTVGCWLGELGTKQSKILCRSTKIIDGTITIKQDYDITKTGYFICSDHDFEYLIGDEWCKSSFDKKYGIYANFSFEKPIKALRFSTKHNFVDPLVVPVQCIEADKEAYYAKKDAEIKERNRQDLIAKAQIKHATGNDLVNIYFQPCREDYSRTEITLYKVDKNEKFMLSKYKVDEEVFFKSITGLAYGKYAYKVRQYTKKNDIIFETDYIEFNLSAPYYGDGRNTVVIGGK